MKMPCLKTVRILIVEDNEIATRCAETILKGIDSGILLDFAKNGTEAVEKASAQAYNLIFMDVGLPDFQGTEATRRIRAQETEKNREPVPIIGLTAHADAEPCLNAGMQACLTKPLRIEQAVEIIEKYLFKLKV